MTDAAAHDSPSERDVEPLDLDAIEARTNAAVSGPWRSTWPDNTPAPPGDLNDVVVESLAPGMSYVQRMVVGTLWHDGNHAVCSEENAAFIAHARTDVPALVAEVRRLRTDNDALRARVAELELLAAGPSTREPMGFAEAIDAVRRGPVGPSGCARCGEIATAACDACGVHLCSVCGATPTCDDGDPCALRRYPHPDKEPLLCVDLDAWGRALG